MHILSRDRRVSDKKPSTNLAFSPSSTSASASASAPRSRSWAWSILFSVVILNSFLSILSPSTAGGKALAALTPGFCGDCQTFAYAIAPCGGTFVPTDIEIDGEYVLQQAHSKCVCSDVMQKVLWTCAKCEFLAGHQSKGPPPQKYQTQCMAWGMTIDEWKAPYTGQVAPGTQTELGNGGVNPPAPPPSETTGGPGTKPTQPGGGNGGGNGGNGSKPSSTDPDKPSASSDNSVTDGSAQADSGPNTTAIIISVCIIGVAGVAGAVAVVMMKRRRRRRTPLDLDSSPALANFMAKDDQWDKPRPSSPPLPPAPVASAAPVVGGGRHHQYDQFEGSVAGGYDPKYDQYDQYGHPGGHPGGHGAYDGYGQGQYGQGQYPEHHYQGQYDQGYHPQQEAYPMHDYGYDHSVSGAPHHGGSVVGGDSKYR
ncbi:hypothetical protein BG011_006236 [Mortierella polycephala]|uniref:Transmembrane protein n=1 Tax=Mortierella polycephala TaxID=41804 RepID=A0A9P6PVC2_9FUNG|nr:hypothetical protein BG011_006236 [Mortierella polycephala]